MQVLHLTPPVVRDVGNGFEIDQDFLKYLTFYLEAFESYALACPVRKTDAEAWGLGQCVPITDLPWAPERFKFIPLPSTYRPTEFLRALPETRKLLRKEIAAAEYLIFAPYSLIGDWPTVAIREAVRMRKRYTLIADGVHGDIMRKRFISHVPWKRWVKRNLEFPMFDASYRYNLRHSSLALFQGQDVYRAYAPYCSKPIKTNHHVPVDAGDHIGKVELNQKTREVLAGSPLRIAYAGRAIDMKGPLDWVATLRELRHRGIAFEAVWLGDGPALDQMKAEAPEGVEFPGFIEKHDTVMSELKQAHIFLFCHNTLESARILGEALACGAPIVGFRTDYPADLVSEHGGGLFCEIGDVSGLADLVASLDASRSALAQLIEAAARSGREFDRDAALQRIRSMVLENRADSLV